MFLPPKKVLTNKSDIYHLLICVMQKWGKMKTLTKPISYTEVYERLYGSWYYKNRGWIYMFIYMWILFMFVEKNWTLYKVTGMPPSATDLFCLWGKFLTPARYITAHPIIYANKQSLLAFQWHIIRNYVRGQTLLYVCGEHHLQAKEKAWHSMGWMWCMKMLSESDHWSVWTSTA